MEQEGRIADNDWSHYTMSNVVFRPRIMTAEELQRGQKATYRDCYSVQSIVRRALTTRGKLTLRLLVNLSCRFIGRGKRLCGGIPRHRNVFPQREVIDRA